MDDAHDLYASGDNSIEDKIASLDQTARLRCDIGSSRAQSGMTRKGGAALFQTVEETVGCRRIVACDIEPDVQQVGFGLPRRTDARQSLKLSRASALAVFGPSS